jgi:signal transduction histidine kinase
MNAPLLNTKPLRLLHLEDSIVDHEIALAHLHHGGIQAKVVRIDTKAEFLDALNPHHHWDAIVSDYNLPGFSGLLALELLKKSARSIPFILVSGEIGEDTAVAAMRNGASDYLLKNNLTRLVPAILHAVDANEVYLARQLADRELGESKRRVQALLHHLQTSTETERTAIAREIHDDVGGSLTALKFDLAWVVRHCDNPSIVQRVNTALETLSHAIEASQRIMHNLRPAILEQGLIAALQWMAKRFEKRTHILCEFHSPKDHFVLPHNLPLVAYRTVQEALTNISKHAKATQVHIDVSLAGHIFSLEISDNGSGFNPQDLTKEHSFGLRGLQERAHTIGGWIDLSSTPLGTSLMLSVPLGNILEGSSHHPPPTTIENSFNDNDPTLWN